jgi:hypothetical protein
MAFPAHRGEARLSIANSAQTTKNLALELPLLGQKPDGLVGLLPIGPDGTLRCMKTPVTHKPSLSGRIPLVLLWFIGIPVPILLIIFLIRGCSG